VCMGDFNEIMFQHEKQGGVMRSLGCMDKFQSALKDCGLDDLGYSTWRNDSHTIEGYIRERLDRVVSNMEWRSKFPDYEVINGDPRHSDHRPVILKFHREQFDSTRQWGSQILKFEASWLKEEGGSDLVQEA
jgi:exonuclease III